MQAKFQCMWNITKYGLSSQGVPYVNDKSIADVPHSKSFHGRVHIVHWNNFNICGNVVLSSKIYHFLCLFYSACSASCYKLPPCNIKIDLTLSQSVLMDHSFNYVSSGMNVAPPSQHCKRFTRKFLSLCSFTYR